MLKKIIGAILLLVFLITITNNIYASGANLSSIVDDMAGVQNADTSSPELNNTLATIIKMIQFAGTGIALIVVTLYGIKYMLASPADKADVKKQIFPILIGCGLLFATVNLVGIIANMTLTLGSTLV